MAQIWTWLGTAWETSSIGMSGSEPAAIEIDEDQAFQRRTWVVERMGWCALALLLAAALLGLLGAGPLSEAQVALPANGGAIEYARVARHQSATTLRVTLGSARQTGGALRISLNRDYLEGNSVEGVLPLPRDVEVSEDRLTYIFAAGKPPVTIIFRLRPDQIGLRRARIALDPGEGVAFTQVVLP